MAACSGGSDTGRTTVQSAVAPSAPDEIDPVILRERRFGEAPMLAARVASGNLPPVADRLPGNPLVVRPLEQIGNYGGTLRRAILSEYTGHTAISKTLNENLMGFTRPVGDRIVPNLADSFEFSEGGRVAVFRLRKGVKWSDGAPFTVNDLLFWYYDVLLNADASDNPLLKADYVLNGESLKLERLDDHTLRVSAESPMGMLLIRLSHDTGAHMPKHYFSRYHPRYNPDASYEEFRRRTTKSSLWMNPELPRLSAWIPVKWVKGREIIYTRNPYYWKVDTQGNQLPYADTLAFTAVSDPRVILLKFLNNEIDLIGRNVTLEMVQTLRSAEKNGEFRINTRQAEPGPALYLNWDAPDERVKAAFRDIRVRRALAIAINRKEIGALVFNGMLVPGGYACPPSSPYYLEAAYRSNAGYEPQRARELLEDAGYADTDGDSYREFRDGRRFEITIDLTLGMGLGDIGELLLEYWKEIGVYVNLNPGREEIIYPRRMNGTFHVYLYKMVAGIDPRNSHFHWALTAPNTPFWHRTAHTDGPEWMRRATDVMNRALTSVDPVEVKAYMLELQEIYAEYVPCIGLGALSIPWASNNRLGNVPRDGTYSSAFRGWSRTVFHEQVFIDSP
jgi:peptide/nickel transport system substrate-binding protein